MDTVIDELRQLWSAGWPYVQLCSVDEERVVRLLRDATDAWGIPLTLWSQGTRSELAEADALMALRTFAEGEGAAMLLLLDMHDAPRRAGDAARAAGPRPAPRAREARGGAAARDARRARPAR
jgi:hypothetical protein